MTKRHGIRLRLAEAARGLAMECVSGTAPVFGVGVEFRRDGSPCCALGHVLARAGFHPEAGRLYAYSGLADTPVAQNTVTRCNDRYSERDGLPWALLWLADELESQL